jgi:hypothetical protein
MRKIKLVFTLGVITLLAGCSNILNAPDGSAPKTGTVSLTVNQGSGARTVFPSIAQFSRVALSFVRISGANDVDDVEVVNGIATINLPVGSWNVTAEAYIGDSVAPAAHSTATHTLLWSGTGDVNVTGGTSFVLEPTGSGNGILHGAVKPGITLGAGSHITITNLSGPSVVFEQYLTEGMEGDMSLAEGRYYVDVVLENEDGSASAVYHRTVVILSGLMTEVSFEPGVGEFLSEEARAAMSDLEGLIFRTTEINVANIVIDSEDFVNISISAPNGTNPVYFTVSNPDGLTLTPASPELGWVADAEGSYSSAYMSVFEVDTNDVAGENGGEVFVVIAAAEEGREAIPITVTVTVAPMGFGLYVDTGVGLDRVDYPITDLNDAFVWLAANAVDSTDYVILLDTDDGLTQYTSKTGVSNVTVTLRGLFVERTVTYKTGSYTGTPRGLFYIDNGTSFVLGENITLDGQNTPLYTTSDGSSMVYVNAGGAFVMMPGSKITRVVATYYGVVDLAGSSLGSPAYFTMKGGVISGNTASAVKDVGSFLPNTVMVMEDGEICNNITYYLDGAITLVSDYDFTMRDGKISGNKGNGVNLSNNGTFKMEGGEISGNGKPTMSGPYTLGQTYNNGGYLSASYVVLGAGVYLGVGSNFIMTGGKILDNGTMEVHGSGVYQTNISSSITLNGPVEINGNSINVIATSSASANRSKIKVGTYFENLGDDPITVDVVGGTNASTLLSYWTAESIVDDTTKLGDFMPGKAGIGYYANFTLFANGYTINPSTGVLVTIP